MMYLNMSSLRLYMDEMQKNFQQKKILNWDNYEWTCNDD